MKIRYPAEDGELLQCLNEAYGLDAVSLAFIPIGDAAYSYRIVCRSGVRYYLKLFDMDNDGQRKNAQALDHYLPLTWELYHQAMFQHLTVPIKNNGESFQTIFRNEAAVLVLFSFVEGETLADAYPLSKPVVGAIAETLAEIHCEVTPRLRLERVACRTETYDISFAAELTNSLSALESGSFTDVYLKALRSLLLPRMSEIGSMIGLLRELQLSAQAVCRQPVLCHGDVWGGNLIVQEGRLMLLDWESCRLAPPERDVFGYLNDEFDTFYQRYTERAGTKLRFHTDLLRFYAYRHHLSNLSNWLLNMLYRHTAEAQRANDLEMIDFHCIRRWSGIEAGIRSAERVMSKERT
ncbi:aminoglycoside phosphotransferase family protein [Paenibacillus piri]|uniref:Aminoglycoside phosphotransferase family protein n=1 Tax=Paenibacillus piri TaxID=2547395 RepID=A0A4R5KXS3_9BACL|nr:aminoglycoside phosphotransferase family protein [Paenibacillus piri]TDG00627.1 aminoglycoside phosphotransferase family protein [Paenibacillus piri]